MAMPNAENLTFLLSELGKPFSATGFNKWFRNQCDVAGKNLSRHGLHMAGAARLSPRRPRNHGLGRLDDAARHTRAANEKRLALQAADKLKRGTEAANFETL